MAQREIALFGGSFNPPHVAHVFLVAHVLACEPVEAVWVVPCFRHAFGKPLAPFDLRVRMLEAALAPFGERARVLRVEQELGGTSRTIDTVRELERRHPGTSFAWLAGADLLNDLSAWKEPQALREHLRFIVLPRPGLEPVPGLPPLFPPISSTEVRARVKAGLPLAGWVPRGVQQLIEQERLYVDG
jgi:nicotinate-nucleotide adenylyltransferase